MHRRKVLLSLFTLPFGIAARPYLAGAAALPAVGSGQGMVVFYRPKRARGGALRFVINKDGQPFGNLANGAVLPFQVKPGTYSFSVSGPLLDGHDAITVSVSAGQTVFIRGEIRAGWPAGRPKFIAVPEGQGNADVAKM